MFSLSIKSCLKMDNQCTCNIIYLFQLKRNCSHRSPKVLEEWPIHLGSVRGLRKWTLQVLKMWGQTWRIWDAKFRSASTKSTENCDYLVGWWSLRSTPRTQFNSRIKKKSFQIHFPQRTNHEKDEYQNWWRRSSSALNWFWETSLELWLLEKTQRNLWLGSP